MNSGLKIQFWLLLFFIDFMFIYIPCQHNFVQVAGYILIDILQFIFYICVMVNFRTFYFKVYESNSLSEMQAIYRVMGRFMLDSWILLSVSCLPWLTWPRESFWLIKHTVTLLNTTHHLFTTGIALRLSSPTLKMQNVLQEDNLRGTTFISYKRSLCVKEGHNKNSCVIFSNILSLTCH